MIPIIITEYQPNSVRCYALLTPLNTGAVTGSGSAWTYTVVQNGLTVSGNTTTRAQAVDAMLTQLQQ